MISPRHRLALLLTVVVAGGVLRFGAVGYGLPRHDLGQDEMITALRVRDGVLTGRPGWPTFHWPNLNVYLSLGAVATARWLERAAGLTEHDDVLIGRVYTAALCTLTFVLLYLVAARLFDPLVGVVAAGFLAVIPLHAFRSRLWVPDAPMTFFYTLALLAAVGIVVRPTYTRFALAGAAVGLATATKYNGVGACLPVLVAALLALPRVQDRWPVAASANRLVLAAAVSVATFFAVEPLALPLFDRMLGGMGFVGDLYTEAPATGLLGWRTWRYIASSFFFSAGYEGVGPLISVLALVGWVWLLIRRSRSGVLVWLPGLLYLLAYCSLLRTAYERALLPLTVHIAVAAAVALVDGARWLESRAKALLPRAPVASAVILAALLVAAVPVTGHVVASRYGETRVKAADWLDANVPAGAFVMREWDMIEPTARHFSFNRRVLDLWGPGWTPKLVACYMDYVVTTSTNFRWVRQQRSRTGLDRKAFYYDELFDGATFELVAKFEPDLHTFGPEVRIYRSLTPAGRVLGPGKRQLDLLQPLHWVSDDRLRRGRRQGSIDIRAGHDLVAGKIGVRPAGRYALEVTARSPGGAQLEIGLGSERRTLLIESERTVRLESFLRRSRSWWRVGAGDGFQDGDEITLVGARLVRVSELRPRRSKASEETPQATRSPPSPLTTGR
jgi:hypothetical protein